MPTVHLSAAVEQYGAARATRYSSTTVKNEMSVLQRLVHNLGNPTVDKVTPGMIEGWFASVMKPHTDRIGIDREPVAASTANYYRTRIQSLQRYCTQRGWTTTDWLAHSPRMRQAKRTRQQPAVDLLLAMLDATNDPRNRAVLAVAMNTGLRSSEIGLLKVGDVDLNTLTLRTWINKSLLEDEMPMTSDLAGELRTWMRTYAKRIGRPLIPADHLLPAYAGPRIGYRKDENGTLVKYMRESVILPHRPALKLHRIAQEALRSVGLDTKGEGIHTLRRATARAFYDSLKAQGHEAAIRQVMVLLHHSNQSTTESYLGVTPEREARNVSLRGRSFLRRSTTADVLPLRTSRL